MKNIGKKILAPFKGFLKRFGFIGQREYDIMVKHRVEENGKQEVLTELVPALRIDKKKNHFRVIGNPLLGNQPCYGSLIHAELGAGKWHFQSIIKASKYKVKRFSISKEAIPMFTKVGKEVVAIGGSWERVAGGLVFFYIPKKIKFDVEKALKKYLPPPDSNE